MNIRSEKTINFLIAGILISALLVRIWWFQQVNTQPVTDFDWYFERAKELARGLGYQVDGSPTAYWPPGFPIALSLIFRCVGPSILAAKIFNIALTILIVFQTYLLGRRLSDNPILGIVAALITAIFPPLVAYSTIIASEPLFTALTLAGCLSIYHKKPQYFQFILAGIAFSLAALVRPQAILLPLFLVPLALWNSHSITTSTSKSTTLKVLALLTALTTIQIPWIVRNINVYSHPVFISTNGGDNLWIGHNPNATGRYMDPGGRPAKPEIELKNDKSQKQLAMDYLKSQPSRIFKNTNEKLTATFLDSQDVPYWAFQTHKGRLISPGTGSDKPLYKWAQTISKTTKPWLLWIALFGTILALMTRTHRTKILLPIAIIIYTALLSIAFFGNPRFGFPTLPFQSIAAAFIPLVFIELFKTKKSADNQMPTESLEDTDKT